MEQVRERWSAPDAPETKWMTADKAPRALEEIRGKDGLGPDQVEALMRQNLKPGSYRAWRKRVRQFDDWREVYK